jgi:hypothetical protein
VKTQHAYNREEIMRSLLKPLTGLVIAVLLIGGGVVVFFGHTTADAIVAPDTGKPSLKMISGDSEVYSFQLSNTLPGRDGCISKRIVNVGNRAGILSVCFSPVLNTPGTVGEYADGKGDLGANIELSVYIDMDANGDWNSGDIGLRSDVVSYNYPTTLDYDVLDNYSGVTWNAVESMQASSTYYVIIMWRIPVTVGNEIQGDSVSFDTTFVLEDDIH